MRIEHIESWPVLIPLRGSYRSGHGAKTAQPGLVVRVRTASCFEGVGNVDPSPGYSSHTAEECHAIIRDGLAPALRGRGAESIRGLLGIMDRVTDAPEAKAAIEMALFDLNAKALGVPVHRLLGGAVRQEISLNGWVGMVEPEEAAAIASDFAARGFPSVKVKVGNGVAADSARVAAVRAANPGLKIRIDANESLDAEASIALGRAIEKYDIALFEQPVARDDLDEMARVRRAIDIPIMADESVYRLESIIEIIRREAADIIKLKVMKQGGLLRTLQGIEICEAAKIKCVVGHGFGSTLHTLAELHLVAVCDNVLEGCEAVGPIKLADDVVVDRLSMARGTMAIPAGPGLGASLDPGKLQRYAANGPVDPESNSTRRH